MSVRRRKRKYPDGRVQEVWLVDVQFEHSDGRFERVRKVSPVQTRRGAEEYERQVRQSLLSGTFGKEQKEVPTLLQFEERFLVHAETNNKRSTVKAKRDILKKHLIPAFGRRRLDEIGPYDLEKYKAAKLKTALSAKTVNNHLTTLRKLLSLAVEWG